MEGGKFGVDRALGFRHLCPLALALLWSLKHNPRTLAPHHLSDLSKNLWKNCEICLYRYLDSIIHLCNRFTGLNLANNVGFNLLAHDQTVWGFFSSFLSFFLSFFYQKKETKGPANEDTLKVVNSSTQRSASARITITWLFLVSPPNVFTLWFIR